MSVSQAAVRARRGVTASPAGSPVRADGRRLPDFDFRSSSRFRLTMPVKIGIIISICAVIACLQFFRLKTNDSKRYSLELEAHERYHSVVIDAGSSGTRIYAFAFRDESLSQITQEYSRKVKPGLSACFDQPRHQTGGEPVSDAMAFACARNQTHKLLQGLLAAGIGIGPKSYQPGIDRGADEIQMQPPVYVRATAGLRLLSQSQQEVLLGGAEQGIADAHHFAQARFESQRPRVASGEEEALYDWLAVNVAKLGMTGVQVRQNYHHQSFGRFKSNAFSNVVMMAGWSCQNRRCHCNAVIAGVAEGRQNRTKGRNQNPAGHRDARASNNVWCHGSWGSIYTARISPSKPH